MKLLKHPFLTIKKLDIPQTRTPLRNTPGSASKKGGSFKYSLSPGKQESDK